MSRIFSNILADVVNRINADATISEITGGRNVAFLYGHYQSIADELIIKGLNVNTRDEKYPLILLGIDNEYIESDINDRQYTISANIWIVDETKKEWLTSERYENVFTSIIYPIYELFTKYLFSHSSISSYIKDVKPTVLPIPYWGTQTVQGSDKQIVNDPLDALKVKLTNIIVNKSCN